MSYARPIRREWCIYCQKHHEADRWYTTCSGGSYCHYAYRRAELTGLREAPVAFLWLREHVHDVDNTGSRIVALCYRADIRGLCDVWAMATATRGWRAHAAFLCGLALQLYWPQSMLIFAIEVLRYRYDAVDRAVLVRVLSVVRQRVRGMRIVGGVLCAGSRGMDPMSNPSERRNGSVRYLSMAAEVDQWASIADSLQTYMSSGEPRCSQMLRIIHEGGLVSYRGLCDYGNMRLLRCLIYCSGQTMADTTEWWDHLYRMSGHLRDVSGRNAMSYEVALRVRDCLRSHLGMESYGLSDLTCFLCLVR